MTNFFVQSWQAIYLFGILCCCIGPSWYSHNEYGIVYGLLGWAAITTVLCYLDMKGFEWHTQRKIARAKAGVR